VRLRSALAASTAAVAIVTTPTLLSCVPTVGTVDEPAATQPAAAQCPGTAPPDFFTFGAAPTREVAAAPIVIATICRYGGANEPQGRGALVAFGVVRGDELAELMRRLEASDDVAQPVPCPTSFGAKHVLYLGTAAGSVQRIDVHLGGCGFVATDTATYWSTEELREFLAAHVG
jgi:hypothetical protein